MSIEDANGGESPIEKTNLTSKASRYTSPVWILCSSVIAGFLSGVVAAKLSEGSLHDVSWLTYATSVGIGVVCAGVTLLVRSIGK